MKQAVPNLRRALATQAAPIRYLIVDGYTKTGRQSLRDHGCTEAGILYKTMLSAVTPGAVECDIIYPSDTGFHMPELQDYSGIAVTGSSLMLGDAGPEVQAQINATKAFFASQVPIFGSCWALQIACLVAGGTVGVSPRGREFGISRKIELSPSGRAHPMFEGKPTVFDALTSHQDEVKLLSPASSLLASNAWSAVQAVDVSFGGRFWAVQYHPEYDFREIARLATLRAPGLLQAGAFATQKDLLSYVQDLETLHEDPTRTDLAFRFGVDGDLNTDTRWCEVRNWIRHLVLPRHAKR